MLAVMLKMNDEIVKQRVTLHNSIMNCALLECSSKLCMDVTSIERFGTSISKTGSKSHFQIHCNLC